MNDSDLDRLMRRGFAKGLSGKEAFQIELEAAADAGARAKLEQAEADDRNMHHLLQAIERPTPWYTSTALAMAASAVLAAGLTLLVTRAPDDPGMTGLASASVYYLEATRSATEDELPLVIRDPAQAWATLVLYPPFDDFEHLVVEVQRRGTGAWTTVWTSDVDAGNRDALVITLPQTQLQPGIHRVNVRGLDAAGTTTAPVTSLSFRVMDDAGGAP